MVKTSVFYVITYYLFSVTCWSYYCTFLLIFAHHCTYLCLLIIAILRNRPNSSPVRPQKLKIALFCIIFHAEHAQTTLNPSNPSRTREKSKSSLLRPIHLTISSFCIIFHAEHDKTTLNPSNPQKRLQK